MAELSVILPVYNGAAYLEKCLHSILAQTLTDFELLCVDDGSYDRTPLILEKYERLDERVRVITTENHGVASARKLALQAVKGRFVTFVDADDEIEETFFEEMMSEIGNCDLLTSGYVLGEKIGYDWLSEGVYQTDQERKTLLSNMIFFEFTRERGIAPYIWGKLYRRALAQEVSAEICERITFGEDSEFLYRYLLKCESVRVSRICGYHYCQHPESVTHQVHRNYLRSIIDFYDALEPVFLAHPFSDALVPQLQMWVLHMTYSYTRTMDFSLRAQSIVRFFPEMRRLSGKRIVLYGAGTVGLDYYNYFVRQRICEVVLWVDQRRDTALAENVSPVDRIRDVSFEYVVLAISREETAEEIRQSLMTSFQVEKDKILWAKPVFIDW